MPPTRCLEPARTVVSIASVFLVGLLCTSTTTHAQKTAKPVLHGSHWVAVTGKPLAATAGAMTFTRGGNAVDAACAMLAATSTMWDTLGWGGETQALIYNPHTGEVKGINALGVAPTGATAEFFKEQGMSLSARVRPTRRGHAGDTRRAHGHAGRVRPSESRPGLVAGDGDGRGLSHRKIPGRQYGTPSRNPVALVVLGGCVPPPPR